MANSRECTYWILVLLLGLSFYTDHVHGDDKCVTDQKLNDVTSNIISNFTTQVVDQMKERMDKLEMLLYKVLAATDCDNDNSVYQDVCSFNNVDDCSPGDITCTSINLLTGTSTCQMCVQGGWQSKKPCKPQWEEGRDITINDIQNNVHIYIDKNGGVSGEIINESIALDTFGYNCVWSRYIYNNSSSKVNQLKKGEGNQFLFCHYEKKDFHKKFYCVKIEGSNSVCYEKTGSCSLNNDNLSCKTKEYNSDKVITLINNKPCTPLKGIMESLDCTITTAIVSDDDLSSDDVKKWDEEKVNVTVTCSGPKTCSLHVSDLCDEQSNKCIGSHNVDGTSSPATPPPSTSGSNSSTLLLILIIVILLVLLLSYCGYQNQWHHKISNLVNGTEGEAARPKPSNGRGRMKGKYAPLPRSMEETLPRHDD